MGFFRLFLVAFIFMVFSIAPISAAQPFDVNGDGQEGLPEAIHALQVTSGLAAPASLAGYDLAEYLWQDGGEYLMEYQRTSNQTYSRMYTISRVPQGDDAEQIVITINTGEAKLYYLVTPIRFLYQGNDTSIGEVRETHVRYEPAAVYGSRNMHIGDVFGDYYQQVYSCATPGYDCNTYAGLPINTYLEYTFQGVEDVTVPAGTFTDCIKLVTKGESSVTIYYYAKNIGLVKRVDANGRVELSHARIGSRTYPDNTAVVNGQGNWNDSVAGTSGTFHIVFNPNSLPIYASLYLDNYHWAGEEQGFISWQYLVKSTDGINFVPDPDYYDGSSQATTPPALTLTVENNTITGTVDNATLNGTY